MLHFYAINELISNVVPATGKANSAHGLFYYEAMLL